MLAHLPPTAGDGLLVAALFVSSALVVRHALDERPWLWVFQTALLLPLLWRRRAPLTVFGAVAAAALAQWSADVQLLADVALLVALYTVASRSGRAHLLVAGVVLEAGILMASVRWSSDGRCLGAAVSLTAMAVAATVIGTNLRTGRAYLASLEDRALRLERERDQRARLAVARERARIAREMHDIVSHSLSVMVALADGAVFAQPRTPGRATAAMRQISGTGRQALTDMRRFLGVLRADEPDALRHPMPGAAQLGELLEQVRTAGLPTVLRLEGDPAALPATVQLTVYRLVQEALTNTLEHTPPGTRAEVRVRCPSPGSGPRTVTVEVTDDGRGRTVPPPGPLPGPRHRDGHGDAHGNGQRRGHGIPGMRERVAAYGGTLEAGPLPGYGWRVLARLGPDPAGNGAG